MASNRNKHDKSLMRREDFFIGIRCNTVPRGKRNCQGWMHPQLAQYYPNGPIFEEMCCLKCNKTFRVKRVSRGGPRPKEQYSKEADQE